MIQHSDFGSALAAIREQERILEKEIRTAQEHADACIAQARAHADAIKTQAERDGVGEAETLYQEGLALARTEASMVTSRGDTEATTWRETGCQRIPKAVEYIVRFILPRTNDDESLNQ